MSDFASAAAHSPNDAGGWHLLSDHLREVGDRAASFAEPIGLSVAARWAGRWHDLGKVTNEFQRYLQACVANPATAKNVWAPHKMAGAVLAAQHQLAPLALSIAGHHGGMENLAELKSALRDELALPHTKDALAVAAREDFLRLDVSPQAVEASFGLVGNDAAAKRTLEFLTRVLFSCLVDADFLDTEAHFDANRAGLRHSVAVKVEGLHERYSLARSGLLANRAADRVAADRTALYDSVLTRAIAPTGVFTLTAPTGSGKTVAGLGFALAHALHNGLRRIVMAAPFVSITEQTAEVYRSLLDTDDDSVVIEHHSGGDGGNDDAFTGKAVAQRLAAENWDAEVVVTTTVQLLESLFSNKPASCRKLHRLAGAVIVIDEAQSIPFTLLDPTLDALRTLSQRLGSSVVLSTATQPPFERLPSMSATPIVELVDDPAAWSTRFARVSIDRRAERLDWESVANVVSDEARAHRGQCLAVFNTIDDAVSVSRALDGTEGLVHLSTRLCPGHRGAILRDVRRRLDVGEPCVLVSTQVVEAGVDVSFPIGVRAVGPAIALAQVAGRINRHGEQATSRLVVVDPIDGHCPPGDYKVGRDVCRGLLAEGVDVLSEPGIRTFYDRLFAAMQSEVDRKGIQGMRAKLAYRDIADAYRVIADDTVSVFVDWGDARAVLASVQNAPGRVAMRRLQPYLVSLRTTVARKMREQGLIGEIPRFGLVEQWHGSYDPVLGLQAGATSEEW